MDKGLFPMRIKNILVSTLALGFVASASSVLAEEIEPTGAVKEEVADKAWSVDLSTAFLSDYMFRGFNLYDGASIQPSVTASYDTGYGEVSANLWMHLSAEGDRQAEKFTELDETISWAYTFDPVTIKLGHVWYNYPDDSDAIDDSAEFFVNLVLDDSSFNDFFPLTPTFSFYHEYRITDAQYYELVFSHLFEPEFMGKGFNITPFVNIGFASNAEKVYDDEQGLVQVIYGISSSVPLGDVLLIPSLNYTSSVDDAATNEFWFGSSVNYSF